jgi:hypothetical protein
MQAVVELPGLSRQEADRRAADMRIDTETVEIIDNGDNTFTVRATFPEGMVVPGATAQVPSNSAPFTIDGLSQAAADAEVAFFRDSGATVQVTPAAGGLFSVTITPTPPPPIVQPPAPTTAVTAPALDGYVICFDRIRTERRPGAAFDRTVSRYQAFFNRVPIPEISGMAVERQGPSDNGPSGVSNHRRIEAGTYPLATHDGASNDKYMTIGFATPANIQARPWPCLRVMNTGSRQGILIHCAAGYLMSIGCLNLTANVVNAQTNLLFSDSWGRVKGLIDNMRSRLGSQFPSSNNVRVPNTSLVIRENL